ncbi:major tail protein [Arthrobacter phage Eileen]|uniref:Major tail protein n=2 Tax=Bridgettevirus TaxID=2733170 RepID=A0A3G2KI87_9CAUD|nr:major tail protein [Arthrobacter phage Eileen]YP_009815564.1 major tail protein [Arthrobacter phage Peas]AYN57806.1 major tail protein [Arthrobacter phage Eileen]AYN58703.1 major tail protein [Arthrobacter phage Peas]
MTEIPSTPADGNEKVLLVPAIANTAAPTLTELTAPGVVDISCYLTGDGWSPSLSEQVITDERKCSKQTYEQPGRSQRGLDVTYIDNTNSPNATTDNKAKDTLVPGVAQYVVVRRGKDFEAAIATADKVSVSPIKPGQYNELPGAANEVLKISQKLFITGKHQVSVAVVAGS